MGKVKKVLESRKPSPITAVGYGERIRRALDMRRARTHERPTLEQVGAAIARLIGRKSAFTAGTVSGWLEERSEPPLVVFLALGHYTGAGACPIAFGPQGRLTADNLRGADETPPGYYTQLDAEEEKGRGSA